MSTVAVVLPGAVDDVHKVTDALEKCSHKVLVNPHWSRELLLFKMKESVAGEVPAEQDKLAADWCKKFESLLGRPETFQSKYPWIPEFSNECKVIASGIVFDHFRNRVDAKPGFEKHKEKEAEEWKQVDDLIKKHFTVPGLLEEFATLVERGYLLEAPEPSNFIKGADRDEELPGLHCLAPEDPESDESFLNKLKTEFDKNGYFFLDTGKLVVQAFAIDADTVMKKIFRSDEGVKKVFVIGVSFSESRDYFWTTEVEPDKTERENNGLAETGEKMTGGAWTSFHRLLGEHLKRKGIKTAVQFV